MLGGPWGTAGVIPLIVYDGNSYTYQYNYTIPALWKEDDIKIVAIVQRYNADPTQREILNADIMNMCSLTATITDTTDVYCGGDCSGSTTITPTEGTPPYLYSWSDGQTDSTAINLCANIYTITVTDSNMCSVVNTIQITDTSSLAISITDTSHITCNGLCNGIATATVSGGTPLYNYVWSNGQTTQTADSLCAGINYVTVYDNNLCSRVAMVTITEPAPISINYTTTDVDTFGQNTGAINITVNGGMAPYTYSWSNGSTTQYLDSLIAGIYTVTVTDSILCTATETIEITQPSSINEVAGNSNIISIYPNPTRGEFTLEIYDSQIANSDFRIYDLLGREIIKSKIVNRKSKIDLSVLTEGTYILRILIPSIGIITKKVILVK